MREKTIKKQNINKPAGINIENYGVEITILNYEVVVIDLFPIQVCKKLMISLALDLVPTLHIVTAIAHLVNRYLSKPITALEASIIPSLSERSNLMDRLMHIN